MEHALSEKETSHMELCNRIRFYCGLSNCYVFSWDYLKETVVLLKTATF